MRSSFATLVGTLLVGVALTAGAQQAAPPPPNLEPLPEAPPPPPATSGFGSRIPNTTREIPASRTVLVHGGVSP